MQRGHKILLGSVLAVVVLGLGIVALIMDSLFGGPDFSKMRSAVEVPIVLANKEKSTRMVGPKAPGWVPIGAISPHLLSAVISSEDAAFYSHDGVDMHEIRESIKRDLKEKKWARGGSTITQQVIKNTFLTKEKTLWRKVKEILWAKKLDKALTKQQIIEFYANLVEWGPGIYGIGAASQHYFSTSPSQLTPKQGAFLAMLLPSPVRYHSYFVKKSLTNFSSKRVAQILRVMNRMGFLEDEAYQLALAEPLWETTGVLQAYEGGDAIPSEDKDTPSEDSAQETPKPEGEE